MSADLPIPASWLFVRTIGVARAMAGIGPAGLACNMRRLT